MKKTALDLLGVMFCIALLAVTWAVSGGSPRLVLLSALCGYLFFLSHIVIHACSHRALSGRAAIDRLVGNMLCVPNFHSFEGWAGLHYLHHRYTNDPARDPAYVLPGERWLHYAVTALIRMARHTARPEYRRMIASQRGQKVGAPGRAAWLRDCWAQVTGLGALLLVLGLAFVLGGAAGLRCPILFWIIPWVIGQALMADFNWRTHVDLPVHQGPEPYAAQDTRSYREGVWKLFNAVTFGFYRHAEHHINPSVCLWFLERPHRPGRRSADRA